MGGIKNKRARSAVAQRARCGGAGRYPLVSVRLCSAGVVKVSVLLPRVPQKEESIEQPEFHYDEFGFRVDKEGKASPIPPPSDVAGAQPCPCFRVWQGDFAAALG